MFHYEKIELDHGLPIKLHHFHIQKENHAVERHWHNSIEIVFPLHGTLKIWEEGKTFLLGEEHVHIFNSRTLHQVEFIEDTPYYDGYCLQINYEYLKNIIGIKEDITFSQAEQKVFSEEAIKECFFTLIKEYNLKEEYYYLRIQSALCNLIYTLCTELKQETVGKEKVSLKEQHRVNAMIQYIEHSYQEDLSVEDMASHFDMSSRYFSKLFKSSMGQTPKEYLTSIRLQKSVEMLQSTDYPVIDIALTNGFPNMNSFYDTFQKAYGETPVQFRKKYELQ